MESRPSQQAQGMGSQSHEPVNFPLRPGEQVVFVTRWDGGWANSIATFVILGIGCLLGLIIGDFWAFVGLVIVLRLVEKRVELVVLAVADGIVLVRVALSAPDGEPEERGGDDFDRFGDNFVASQIGIGD